MNLLLYLSISPCVPSFSPFFASGLHYTRGSEKGGFFYGFHQKASAPPACRSGAAALLLHRRYAGQLPQYVPQSAGAQPGPAQCLPQPAAQRDRPVRGPALHLPQSGCQTPEPSPSAAPVSEAPAAAAVEDPVEVIVTSPRPGRNTTPRLPIPQRSQIPCPWRTPRPAATPPAPNAIRPGDGRPAPSGQKIRPGPELK